MTTLKERLITALSEEVIAATILHNNGAALAFDKAIDIVNELIPDDHVLVPITTTEGARPMNYEEMSDFEINKAVAKIIHPAFEPLSEGDSFNQRGDDDEVWLDNYPYQFAPCNSWADAGPIIVENDIEVKPNKKGFDYAQAFVLVQNGRCHAIFSHHCDGVLRAAMIVYLKMQDQ